MDTKQKIEEKVFSFMEKHHMLKATDSLVVGVSGGADSVCLLFVLLEYRKKVPFSITVVHVNHGIRPEAAQDEAYVKRLCEAYQLPFYPFHVNIRKMAERKKCSEEEAGRNARYQAFAKVAEEIGANKIAVAHNCNDRSETMLFHLFRGSSLKGLGSIRPIRDNIIRPILCLERKEVEEYLDTQNISYCRDATNEKDDYTRNRIRHHILPYAEREIVSGCVSHMAQTADMLAEAEDYLEQQTRAAMEKCVRGREIEVSGFLQQHQVIRQRILFAMVTGLTASGKDISFVHIQSLMSLFMEDGNRSVNLPYGIVGRRQYGTVIIEREEEPASVPETVEIKPDELPYRIALNEGNTLEICLLSKSVISQDFPTNQYTKWLDYDKIKKSLVLRTRQTGDYLTIAGKDGRIFHKSLKDYMIGEKIPQRDRDSRLLLADGQHVVWLIGYRISEEYKISRNTKHILQVQLIGKEYENGRKS